ncbi:alpha/beta fold hydrolase [Fibrella arboris]|uniref:alpha/beta fold hydrolase n=1 Tax=Fibrella arboris TaxID=3242486 RepID=UPI003522854E
MRRFILIHGNLNVPATFDALVPLLPTGQVRCIDLADTFNAWDVTMPVTARTVAEHVARTYQIGTSDVLIGHSMGGWLAANIKALTGAQTIQISSWTNPGKIKAPIRNLSLIRRIVSSGIVQHWLTIQVAKRLYPFRRSRARVHATLDRIQAFNPAYIYWQYELIFRNVPTLTTLPDLRIHARRDPVISPPDEPFVDVPGFHMPHVDNVVAVARAIRTFLH